MICRGRWGRLGRGHDARRRYSPVRLPNRSQRVCGQPWTSICDAGERVSCEPSTASPIVIRAESDGSVFTPLLLRQPTGVRAQVREKRQLRWPTRSLSTRTPGRCVCPEAGGPMTPLERRSMRGRSIRQSASASGAQRGLVEAPQLHGNGLSLRWRGRQGSTYWPDAPLFCQTSVVMCVAVLLGSEWYMLALWAVERRRRTRCPDMRCMRCCIDTQA